MSQTHHINDECFQNEEKQNREGAFQYAIFHPKNESSQRCNKSSGLTFENRVNVDSNLKNIGIPGGKCNKNKFNPFNNNSIVFTPPTACSKYHTSFFENNVPLPSQEPFNPEKYYYQEKI